MKSNSILFLVDHKHRDLPSLALIGYILQNKGYNVKFSALWKENEIFREFNPGYIVLPKPVYAIERLVKFKIDGRKTIVINTEGNPQDIKMSMRIPIPPDLYFFWNKDQLDLDSQYLNLSKVKLVLAGCPRMDFLTEKLYQSVFPTKEQLLQKYRLPPRNKTITIATSSQDAHFDEDLLQKKEKMRKKKFREIAEYRKIVKNMRTLRDKTDKIIRDIIENFPNINIIIKPHPNESIIHWQNLAQSLNTNNIFVSVGEPIYHLLKVSDLHISYNVCTTTFEAMTIGVPTVELHTKNSNSFYKPEHLYLADYIIETSDDLLEKVEDILIRKKFKRDRVKTDQLKKYTDKYYFKVDGKRCLEYSNEIVNFIDNPLFNEDKTNILEQIILHMKYFYYKGKETLYKVKLRLDHLTNSGDKKIKINDDKFIDNLGRYDNRIKPGDEKLWYEKFKVTSYFNEV